MVESDNHATTDNHRERDDDIQDEEQRLRQKLKRRAEERKASSYSSITKVRTLAKTYSCGGKRAEGEGTKKELTDDSKQQADQVYVNTQDSGKKEEDQHFNSVIGHRKLTNSILNLNTTTATDSNTDNIKINKETKLDNDKDKEKCKDEKTNIHTPTHRNREVKHPRRRTRRERKRRNRRKLESRHKQRQTSMIMYHNHPSGPKEGGRGRMIMDSRTYYQEYGGCGGGGFPPGYRGRGGDGNYYNGVRPPLGYKGGGVYHPYPHYNGKGRDNDTSRRERGNVDSGLLRSVYERERRQGYGGGRDGYERKRGYDYDGYGRADRARGDKCYEYGGSTSRGERRGGENGGERLMGKRTISSEDRGASTGGGKGNGDGSKRADEKYSKRGRYSDNDRASSSSDIRDRSKGGVRRSCVRSRTLSRSRFHGNRSTSSHSSHFSRGGRRTSNESIDSSLSTNRSSSISTRSRSTSLSIPSFTSNRSRSGLRKGKSKMTNTTTRSRSRSSTRSRSRSTPGSVIHARMNMSISRSRSISWSKSRGRSPPLNHEERKEDLADKISSYSENIEDEECHKHTNSRSRSNNNTKNENIIDMDNKETDVKDVDDGRKKWRRNNIRRSRSPDNKNNAEMYKVKKKIKSDRDGDHRRHKEIDSRDHNERTEEESKKKQEEDELTKDSRTVFVSQLVMRAEERVIKRFFRKRCGIRINDVILLRDRRTGRHKGCAYMELARIGDVPRAVEVSGETPDFQRFPILVKASEAEKNYDASQPMGISEFGGIITGKPVGTGPSIFLEKRVEAQKVYVGSIDRNVTQSHIYAIFSQFGQLDKVLLQVDTITGQSKGFSFLTYKCPKVANLAIQVMAGQIIAGRPLRTGWANMNTTVPGLDEVTSNEFPDDALQCIQKAHMVLMQLNGTGISLLPGLSLVPGASNLTFSGSIVTGGDTSQPVQAVMSANVAENAINAAMGVPSTTMHSIASSTSFNALTTPVDDATQVGGVDDPTNTILIRNVFDKSEETEDGWDLDISEEFEDECSKHGKLQFVRVISEEVGGKIYASFETMEGAQTCARNLAGRWFDKRQLRVSFVQQDDVPMSN